jgi:hypothetical protein
MPKIEPNFTASPARYAGRWNGKPQIAVRCESDGSGMKTRAMRLCSALNARYSHREHAYIMSPTKAAKLRAMFDAGQDACLGFHGTGQLGFRLDGATA